ncbi:hypothetical protein [Aeromonas hydrophila]|uniref:Uncharacterized protein n=1 Tax=Aeromonas hydrophila TaxID=644 RepID=A0ABD7GC47_AERHY|nr:hypothetical protein [Aeromonas hydrophila]MBC8670173.1 hypothetical protein [Aeromonas hydrophila]MBC8687177.1 hypothetical protein [Aeromonas hydrophila]MCO4209551.1 hypothetical protein [Aeromonas hydrophila]RCF52071.1 hypothetical protein C6C11_04365 [Aeromonas hydrophila]
MSNELIKNLKSFNRKERFYLVGQMLGNPDFRMDDKQLDKIYDLINIKIPREYFAAMDYHLDWIYASLYLTQNNPTGRVERNFIEENGIAIDHQISGTQEDVDFLLAFVDHENITHIVMIEAKGDSYFSNGQLDSKNKRFKAIFGNENTWPNVRPHFIICSPKKPQKINIEEPAYFIFKNSKLPWLELDMGNGKNKVTRCDKNEKPSNDGEHWKVESRS